MASTIYNRFFRNAALGKMIWSGDCLKVALLTSTYTISRAHTAFSSVSAYQAVGTGYTAGGKTATGCTVTEATATKLDASDVTWPSSTITARFAAIHNVTSPRSGLVCVFEFTENKSSSSGNFTLQWNASGIMTLQQS